MIKNKGNFVEALTELKNNPAVSFVYETPNTKDGELKDVVVTIKDNYATSDAPTQASSKILEGFKPGYDATVITKLLNEGASIVAKAHLDELALGGTGQYNAYGKIDNPLNKDRMIGGSSSGSAATFTNSIGIAIGSDTGDSVRLPASYIGKYGFKPSYGAISRSGLFAYASSLDTVGYFGHNVDDIITVSKVLFGKDELDMTSRDVSKPVNESIKPKVVGFISNTGLEQYQVEEYSKLKEKFITDGIEVKEFNLDQKLLDAIDVVYQVISYSEASSNNSNLTGISFGPRIDGKDWDEIMHNTRSKLFGELVQRRFTLGAYFLSTENLDPVFKKAQKVRRLIVKMFNEIKEQVDVLVFPATGIAPLISEGKEDTWVNSFLINSNFSGTPSISIPWSKHNGMPFGLAIEGRLYKDKELLSYTKYIDELLGGDDE